MKYLWIFTLSFLAYSQDTLFLNSGELINGRLTSFSTDTIGWQDGKSHSQVKFDNILCLAFSEKAVPNKNNYRQTIEFVDKSKLLISDFVLSNKSSFRWNNQVLNAEQQKIVHLYQGQQKTQVIKPIIGRKALAKTFPLFVFSDKKDKSYLYRPKVDFKNSFSLSFSLNFFMASNEKFVVNMNGGFKFLFKNNLVVFFKDNKYDDFRRIDMTRYSVDMNWNADSQLLTMFIGERLVYSGKMENQFDYGSIYLLKNNAGNLAVWDVELSLYQKKYASKLKNNDYIRLKNNDFIEGKVVSIKNSLLSISESLGQYNIPIATIKEVYFSHISPIVSRGNRMEIHLVQNQKIYAEHVVALDESRLKIQNEILGEVIIPYSFIEMMVFP